MRNWKHFTPTRIVARLLIERGATAIEYSIIAALIAAVVVLSVALLGSATSEGIQCTGDTVATMTEQC